MPAVAVRRSTEGTEEVVLCAAGDAADHGGIIARVRPVEVGTRTDGDVEITSGLAAGNRVVTRHVLGLEDGTAMRVVAPARGARP